MFSLNSVNSVRKIFVITVKEFELPSLALETWMLQQHQQYTCKRKDLQIESNSCFIDLSDS